MILIVLTCSEKLFLFLNTTARFLFTSTLFCLLILKQWHSLQCFYTGVGTSSFRIFKKETSPLLNYGKSDTSSLGFTIQVLPSDTE